MSKDSTEKPGVHLKADEENLVIENFLRRFRGQDLTYQHKVPSWTQFPKGTPVRVDFFSRQSIERYEHLFIFFEFQREVWRACPQDIQHYIVNREPWEDFDLYIFPNNMEWCCVFTHELMDGVQSFVIPAEAS